MWNWLQPRSWFLFSRGYCGVWFGDDNVNKSLHYYCTLGVTLPLSFYVTISHCQSCHHVMNILHFLTQFIGPQWHLKHLFNMWFPPIAASYWLSCLWFALLYSTFSINVIAYMHSGKKLRKLVRKNCDCWNNKARISSEEKILMEANEARKTILILIQFAFFITFVEIVSCRLGESLEIFLQ